MGTDLVVAGRREVAAYVGFANAIRGRSRPIAVIAAVDVLAVGLALGALHLTGAMMGSGKLPQIIPPVSAAEPAATDTPLVPLPRPAPEKTHFAATPDAAVMFSAPVEIAEGFTFDQPPASSSFTSQPPAATAAAEPEQPPAVEQPPVPAPRLRPLAGVAELAAPVIDNADGSLDRLLMRDVPAVTSSVVARTDNVLRATTTEVASAVTAAPVVQAVTQPVAQTVQAVTGTVRGLLN
jgi:hypothetical protein